MSDTNDGRSDDRTDPTAPADDGSGSGPTCAFLVDSESAAVDLSVEMSADGLCRAVRRATGPVVGARVIG